ncbi:hypothetical protein [Pseudomonas fragi]|uniref:Uncharacterized protein n=1 Tax=Pseudomonas fragi TaxID=296 RepID=A0A449IHZ3_PSEFR|nr:hypothetical protein [Pseudomonas fragi]MCU9035219.1 hypothetical protein [Pseudomonas aeruginosa]VFB18940.1 Uncharacterised protein [Pseudomonas fragi]HEJ3365497.1 hypothetical protein [Pseudomonas aeruginosa]HEQ0062379.1 hypothetical protein [Pseudomonas aeruginosa]
MTTSKTSTAVRRICPCLTAINNEVLKDFIVSFNSVSADKFSIAKAFKDFIIYDCATYIVVTNESNSILRKYNQALSNTTNNYTNYIRKKPEYKTEDADKIVRTLRQSRVDISKLLFSTKTFRAEPNSNAICFTEASPFDDESKKSKKLNLTYSDKDFNLIKSKFKALKKENDSLTFDDLFYQFMLELKIYKLKFETNFFTQHATEINAFTNFASQSHQNFQNLKIEDFNEYFLNTFPSFQSRLLESLETLKSMISIE